MITNNPFATLSEIVPPITMQVFLITMIAFVIIGTLVDIIHKTMLSSFLKMLKKQKNLQQRN